MNAEMKLLKAGFRFNSSPATQERCDTLTERLESKGWEVAVIYPTRQYTKCIDVYVRKVGNLPDLNKECHRQINAFCSAIITGTPGNTGADVIRAIEKAVDADREATRHKRERCNDICNFIVRTLKELGNMKRSELRPWVEEEFDASPGEFNECLNYCVLQNRVTKTMISKAIASFSA